MSLKWIPLKWIPAIVLFCLVILVGGGIAVEQASFMWIPAIVLLCLGVIVGGGAAAWWWVDQRERAAGSPVRVIDALLQMYPACCGWELADVAQILTRVASDAEIPAEEWKALTVKASPTPAPAAGDFRYVYELIWVGAVVDRLQGTMVLTKLCNRAAADKLFQDARDLAVGHGRHLEVFLARNPRTSGDPRRVQLNP